MKSLQEIIAKIERTKQCSVSRFDKPIKIDFEYHLPEDLKFYFENYDSIILFQDSDYSIKINGFSEFNRANPIIVGEEIEDDRSYNWFIIAQDDNSQYITLDLAKERLGQCYDSFWDRYGLAGDQPIIAKNFTELVDKLFESKGNRWYWLEDNFKNYGDAYDE